MAKERIRMPIAIKQIAIGDLSMGVPKVFGLGYNNKVYYWTSEGWKTLK